jgi:hypothetical protein
VWESWCWKVLPDIPPPVPPHKPGNMLVGGGKGGAGCKNEGSSRHSQKSEYPSTYVLQNHRILRNEQQRGLGGEGEEIAKKHKTIVSHDSKRTFQNSVPRRTRRSGEDSINCAMLGKRRPRARSSCGLMHFQGSSSSTNAPWYLCHTLTQILKNDCPSIFTIQSHYREYFEK